MRLQFLLVISLTAVGLMTKSAGADGFYDGNALYDDCKTNTSQCMGYIVGVADTILLVQNSNFQAKKQCLISFETGTNTQQLNDVVVNFLRDHPEQRQRAAAGLVWNALGKAFACRE